MAEFHVERTKRYKLTINVIRARNLLGVDIGGKSDPYVKIGWADSDSKCRVKTKVIKKNLNPEWNETFELMHDANESSKLEFSVYDKATLGKDEFLGQARVDLHTLLDQNGKEINLELTPALHTKKNKREKIKGTLTVKVTFPPELFKDIETLKQLKEASKMNAADLETLWSLFKQFSGSKDVLNDRNDIINLAKRANIPRKLSDLLLDCSAFPPEMQNKIKNYNLLHDDELYDYVMQLFDTNKDGDLSLKEFIMGMVLLSKSTMAEKAEVRFNLYDKDGSGILDENELRAMQRDYAKVGRAVFIGTMKFILEPIFLLLSPKSKGTELDKLTQELADRLFSEELSQKGFELMKANIDLNHDGSITKEEYIRFYSDEEIQAKYLMEVQRQMQPILEKFEEEAQPIIERWVMKSFRF